MGWKWFVGGLGSQCSWQSASPHRLRRSARLRGTQTWTDGGKTITRACSGAVKRPFRVFLPRERGKPASQ
jgi:hypothetical protein